MTVLSVRTRLAAVVASALIVGASGCAAPSTGAAVSSPPASGATGNSTTPAATSTAPAGSSSSPAAPASTLAALDEPALARVKQTGTLRVCSTGDYPPFTKRDADGAWSGIDVDMARAFADSLGVRPEFVKTSWKTLMDDYTSGVCDVAVGGISLTPQRAEQASFSVATQVDGKTPITRCEDVEKYDTIEEIDRPGVRSIFPEGGTNEKFARAHYPQGTLITHDNLTIFDALAAGEADVMTTDRAEVLYIAHTHPGLCAADPDHPFDRFEKGYLLPKGDEEFTRTVDAWLETALADGTYQRFAEPWVGDVELGLPRG